MDLQTYVRALPDYPKPGIMFRDITPILKHPEAMRIALDQMLAPYRQQPIDYVAGMEARGFIFGALAAHNLGVGFVPLRKPGKLPYDVMSADYELEYGDASLEIHRDALEPGKKVLIVDDLIATGGTALAACSLVHKSNANVVGCSFLIELTQLGGRDNLAPHSVSSVIRYD